MGNVVYLRKLEDGWTEKWIKDVFNVFGKVVNIRIPLGRNGVRRGCAFIEYALKDDAIMAVRELSIHPVDGRHLLVDLYDNIIGKGDKVYEDYFEKKPTLGVGNEAYVKYPRRSPTGEERIPLPMAPPTPPPSPRPSPPPPEKREKAEEPGRKPGREEYRSHRRVH